MKQDAEIARTFKSPPRVRGIDARASVEQPIVGITPACAGNSRGGFKPYDIVWDHPRVCGE